jgi:hypothetical protein
VWELSSRLPDNAIVTSDSGSCANWYARDLKMRRGMMASLSGGFASMGAAVPYAIAAKFAHPDRPVVGLVGDGAMQMNNMAIFEVNFASAGPRWRLSGTLARPLQSHRSRSKKGLALGRKGSMCVDVRVRSGATEEPFAPTIATIRGSRQ